MVMKKLVKLCSTIELHLFLNKSVSMYFDTNIVPRKTILGPADANSDHRLE